MSRNQCRQLVRKSQQYTLSDLINIPMLQYHKKNGSKSIYLIQMEIPRFLEVAHKDHGNFPAQLSLSFLIGQAYWPTRVKDVYSWCTS